MNYNLLTYSIYLPIVVYITLWVGWLCYKNGEIFLFKIFNNDPIAKTINKILLIGYYLLNIGYAVMTISFWEKVDSLLEVANTLSTVLGKIILILAVLHFNNIITLTYISKTKILNK